MEPMWARVGSGVPLDLLGMRDTFSGVLEECSNPQQPKWGLG